MVDKVRAAALVVGFMAGFVVSYLIYHSPNGDSRLGEANPKEDSFQKNEGGKYPHHVSEVRTETETDTKTATGQQSTTVLSHSEPQNWTKAESILPKVSSESDIESFLKDTRISNLGTELRKASPQRNYEDNLQELLGTFSGEILLRDGSDKIWTFTMETTVVGKNDFEGNGTIEIFDEGESISKSSSTGGLNQFKKFANDSKAMLVEMSPIHFAQLYYLTGLDLFIGNFYLKSDLTDSENYRFLGTLRMKRAH